MHKKTSLLACKCLNVVALAQLGACNFKQLALLFDETHLVCACTAAQGHIVKGAVVNPIFNVISLQAGSQYCLNLYEIASVIEKAEV